ncbi:hypothetical protein fugu_005116 [Takifugu bimaculatus]|uniref:Proline-rich transmembrane protein 3/4 domain-containing protein n=1 Tax=Takifugu bimaculatus TaxID=433685 RepID=A0A4Z2B9J6_9TELE|nr:hypothetical protein fugu_005116 [Takifugu bimaculatus]
MVSPLLSITLILCLSSPGSLQSHYNWDRAAWIRGRNVHEADSSEAAVASEGSGRSTDRAFWSGMIIPKRLQPDLSALRSTEGPKVAVQNKVFTSITKQNPSRPGSACGFGLSSCDVLPSFNGTNLVWDDMKRTLAFAWELHVFGSASLFILMAALAAVGMAGSGAVPHPVSHTLTLSNGLLFLTGALRGAFLLLDPYGTRQVLSHASVVALHNLPLQLLLWAQLLLALVTLRNLNLIIFSLKLKRPWLVGGLALFHCTHLLAADIFSGILSPTVPLLLHTLSLCWGLPLCMGILPKSFSHLHPILRSSLPQWAPSLGIEKCAKSVTAACAFLGVLCCGLQMYSLLWLYGLLGNWKHFGWGWWLSQFWARILELSWGFSLLVLGSWIFWMPSKRGEKGKSKYGAEKKSLWGQILAKIKKGPLKKSEQTLEDLMPSNWAKYNLSKTGFRSNILCPYDHQPTYKPNPVSNSSSEAQSARQWQNANNRECVLSLVEFDMRPPSPINLRRSIDDALYHGQLVAGSLFSSPASSWTTPVSGDPVGGGYPSSYPGYGWTLDAEPFPAGHFQVNRQLHTSCAAPDYTGAHQVSVPVTSRSDVPARVV